MSKRIPRRRVLAGSTLLGTALLTGTPAGGASDETAARSVASTDATEPTESTAPAEPAVSSSNSGSRSAQPDGIDLENLESFVDDRMTSVLEADDVVGASAAVVHDGTVELAAGYGESDRDAGTPVDPDETAFRIGSVSKAFVWTAVMQLIEDGRIDPDEDVETYLESVSIPDAYDEPITIAHLATHTAGFEDRFRGTWVDDPDDLRSLPAVLREEQPERVRPPGEIASYSNYGAALAAQVVADVTGTPFAAYAEEHLFEPLGMDDTTFRQPPPDELSVSAAYTTATGSVRDAQELFLEIAPAGAATATVTDMAQFMRAHLDGGLVDGDRVLESAVVERLHDQWFTHHPELPGIAFGLLEDEHDGVRTLYHNGAIPGASNSYLLLVPEYDLGLFLATNTDSGLAAITEVADDFREEFLPDADADGESAAPEPDSPPERAGALEGTYRGVQVAASTHAKLSSTLQAGSVEVSVDEDGFLATDFGGGPERWVERADDPLVFDAVDGNDTLSFREDAGEITHLFLGFQAFERLSWYDSLSVHGAVAGVSTLGMLSGAVGWPLARATRRFISGSTDDEEEPDSRQTDADDRSRSGDVGISEAESDSKSPSESASSVGAENEAPEPASPSAASASTAALEREALTSALSQSRARWIAGGAITCLFGFVVGFVALLGVYQSTLLSNPPLAYDIVSLLPILGTVGAAAAAGCAIVAWRAGYWGRLSRIHYTLVAASLVGFCWLLYYWNFLRLPV